MTSFLYLYSDQFDWKRLPYLAVFRCGVLLVGLLASSLANSGVIQEARIDVQPSINVKDGKVVACGLRITTMHTFTDGKGVRGHFIDGAINVDISGFGHIKFGFLESSVDQKLAPTKPAIKHLSSFWLKAKDQNPTKPNAKVGFIKSEDKQYLLTSIELQEALDIYTAIIFGEPLMIGVRLVNEKVDRVHKGSAKMSNADRDQAVACLGDLTKSLGLGSAE